MTLPPPPPRDAAPDVPAAPYTDTSRVDPWPYTKSIYAARAAWAIVHATAWKLAWKRLPALRCLMLRAFGAKVPLDCYLAGSMRVDMPFWLELGHHVAIGPRAILY